MKCGVGDYTNILARYLKKTGLNIKILTSDNDNVIEDGISIRLIKDWNFKCIIDIIKYCKENKVNILHIQYPTQGYGFKIGINILPLYLKFYNLFMSKKVKVITTLHEFSQSHILRKISMIPLIMFSDKIITTNKEEKDVIMKWLPFIKETKIEIINIGSNIMPHKETEDIKNSNHIITYFGFIRPDKGLDNLIRAIMLTKVYKEDDFKLNILAELNYNNKYHREILKLIDNISFDKNKINITGYLPDYDISKYLYNTNLSVLPFKDGLTYRRGSFIASIVHNLPVISTYTNLTSKDLLDFLNEYLVEPNNEQELAKAIDRFFYDISYRNKLIEKVKKMKDLFDWNKIALKHKRLYKELE